MRARYDAAQTTDDNRRHWKWADGLSADQSNSYWIRRILADRARYEFENNSYLNGQVKTLANDLIGPTPWLQVSQPSETARAIETEFRVWSRAVKLGKKLRTAKQDKTVVGEAFLVMFSNPMLRARTGVELDLRAVPAEHITTPWRRGIVTKNAIDGIDFDGAGNPVTYHELRHAPDSVFSLSDFQDTDPIDAANVVHLFREDRAGQRRGVPEITPSIQNYADLRRYLAAVIAAAETAADLPYVLHTDLPVDADGIATAVELQAMDVIELEKRMATILPRGWNLGQAKAEQPPAGFKDFKHEQLGEAARCINMPFAIAAGNSSGYNFASGRLDHQTYDGSQDVERYDLELDALDPIFWAWLDEALLAGVVALDGPQGILHDWRFRPRPHIDPQKNANAIGALWEKGHITDDEIAKDQGVDPEQRYEWLKRQREKRVAIGLPLPGDSDRPAEPVNSDADASEALEELATAISTIEVMA